MNPYNVLGVGHNATIQDIKEAFKIKACILHPDKGGSAEKFRELVLARDVLIKDAKEIKTHVFNTSFHPFTGYVPINPATFGCSTPFASPPRSFFPKPPAPWEEVKTAFDLFNHCVKTSRTNKPQYFYLGKAINANSTNYTNVSTNRKIKDLNKKGFIYSPANVNYGNQPLFCGSKEAMVEFYKIHELDTTWM